MKLLEGTIQGDYIITDDGIAVKIADFAKTNTGKKIIISSVAASRKEVLGSFNKQINPTKRGANVDVHINKLRQDDRF